jgi:hypothetical protein
MTIYVDPLIEYPSKPFGYAHWCHMFTDDHTLAGITDLHLMAMKLGLRTYFQDKTLFPHYDLTTNTRKKAIRFGAKETTHRQLIALGKWETPWREVLKP